MIRYAKKPLEADAIQWTGENVAEMFEFLGGAPAVAKDAEPIAQGPGVAFQAKHGRLEVRLIINVPEGTTEAQVGEWIVADADGTFRPRAADAFVAKYEIKQAVAPIEEAK